MDKSLHQQLYNNAARSPYSPRTRQSSASSLSARKAGYKRSNLSYGGGATAPSISGRSNQTILGIRSELNVVESYGFQLPVVVNEALNFSEKNQHVSVMCSPNGWAWAVHLRHLYIWQYKDTRSSQQSNKDQIRTPQRRGASAQCRELTLPHCDIGHKASLVTVFVCEGQQMASCIAVSPTGDVRYWTSIAHDGSTVDANGILEGQEFDYLMEVPHQQGYLLVTTTCNLVSLQLQLVNGRHVLQHKTIKQPTGFLGGFGKKFASIIIGLNSNNDKENKFVSIVSEEENDEDAVVTLLADRWIQRWRIANQGSTEQFLYEDSDIVRKIREEFILKFWQTRVGNPEIELHLLDMHLFGNKMYVLGGAVNSTHAPQMCYGISVLSPKNEEMELLNFIPLKFSLFFSAGTETDCLNLRFVISRSHIYLYTDKVIYPVNLSNPASTDFEAEKIEFQVLEDRILNATVSNNLPLFFSRAHGLVCVTPADIDSPELFHASRNTSDFYIPQSEATLREQSLIDTSMADGNLYMFDLDPEAMFNEFKDGVSQLKAAFIYRLKRNNNMSATILSDLLRTTVEGQTAGALTDTNELDKMVVTIAEDLAEDVPAADPRWEQLWNENQNNRHALGSSSSMQILTQLKEKNLALRHFVDFLHTTGIWDNLQTLNSPGTSGALIKSTCNIISDINEKIMGAIALRSLQVKFSSLIDEAIQRVVIGWNEIPEGALTAQDLFYVRICKFQDLFHALTDIVDERITKQKQSLGVTNLICDINTIVLHLLSEIHTFREQNSSIFSLPADKLDMYEYLPWTAMSGSAGMRDVLNHLVDITTRYGTRTPCDQGTKQKLYQQILELVDYILDGRKSYLDSIRDTEKYNVFLQQYESQRLSLISLLINDEQYELAAKLAEKYLDFQCLVIICDQSDSQERLDHYIKKFEEYDFSQFAINWHLRQNRQGDVFDRFKENQAALSQFMRDHPTLAWIQLIYNGDFERASKTLLQLAQNETELVSRKKTMLSLSKLASIASLESDLSAQVENINTEHKIIEYQGQLNTELLESFGFDPENQKVLKVDEIINLIITDENEKATEEDFCKALELLNYIEEPYEARHKIWCAAILRDNWIDYDVNNAVEHVQHLLFYKLTEYCHLMGTELETFLPPIENFLNADDLEEVAHNTSFQYLLKLTYECINNSFKKSDEMET